MLNKEIINKLIQNATREALVEKKYGVGIDVEFWEFESYNKEKLFYKEYILFKRYNVEKEIYQWELTQNCNNERWEDFDYALYSLTEKGEENAIKEWEKLHGDYSVNAEIAELLEKYCDTEYIEKMGYDYIEYLKEEERIQENKKESIKRNKEYKEKMGYFKD